jgi:ribosomal protein S18 acetylase RimI-like enzyme
MNSSAFTIEQVTAFTPEIAQAMRRLAKQLGPNYKELTDADVQEMIASPIHFLYLAFDKKSSQVAGMILLLVYRIPYLRKAHLDDLAVDEVFRSQGLGTQLLQKAIAVAKEKGVTYVDFTSRLTRGPANKLYTKLGFTKHDTNVYRLVFTHDEA